jgi:pimeloyl-ACP methyl ester carboxylesterase
MASDSGFSDFFYPAADGLRLHARLYGSADLAGWPVVCLPGLTRNCRDFHHLALFLSQQGPSPRRVVAFDYRGRGQSAYDAKVENYNVVTEANDVLAGLDALGIASAAFIGTSRGGLIVHVLGNLRPAVLRAIVLNDIGPVIEAAGLAHIRAYLGQASAPKSFLETVAGLRETHGPDFPALIDGDWERMARALCREEADGWMPDFDPKLVETLDEIDFSKPLPTLWPQFEQLAAVPMLTIRGANSKLLSTATLAQMHARHPAMEAITVNGQGHAPLLETSDLPQSIARFIEVAEQHSGRQVEAPATMHIYVARDKRN